MSPLSDLSLSPYSLHVHFPGSEVCANLVCRNRSGWDFYTVTGHVLCRLSVSVALRVWKVPSPWLVPKERRTSTKRRRLVCSQWDRMTERGVSDQDGSGVQDQVTLTEVVVVYEVRTWVGFWLRGSDVVPTFESPVVFTSQPGVSTPIWYATRGLPEVYWSTYRPTGSFRGRFPWPLGLSYQLEVLDVGSVGNGWNTKWQIFTIHRVFTVLGISSYHYFTYPTNERYDYVG